MNDKQEKRMISDTGYEVRQAFRINGKEILLTENQKAADGMIYLVCQYTDNGLIGEYSHCIVCDDYIEAVQDYVGRINAEAELVKSEHDMRGLPAKLFTTEDCYPHNYGENIENKVVAIKASVLSHEYRRGDVQLVYVTGGSGAHANSRGSAVYCYQLNDGKHTRFERRDVLGVVKELPDWAKESLARVQAEMNKPAEEKEYAGNYEIMERIEVGTKVFALGYCEKSPTPYGTWQGYKNSKGSFDWGHYFNDYESAKNDLHERAAKEQVRIDGKIRSDNDRSSV